MKIKPLNNLSKLILELNKSKRKIVTVYDQFSNDAKNNSNTLSIRVDVDNGLVCALSMAESLAVHKIKASFYFLTSTAPYSIKNNVIKQIHDLGHEVGLHSDHNYLQLKHGKNGLNLMKEDIKLISTIIGEPIKGLCFHGHDDIDKIQFQGNWYLHREMEANELGLEYHDGIKSNYCKLPAGEMWLPPCKHYISDYPFGWRDETITLRNFFRNLTLDTEPAHIILHPANFYQPESWASNAYLEKVIALRIFPKKSRFFLLKKLVRKAQSFSLLISHKITLSLLLTFMNVFGSKKNTGLLSAAGKGDSIDDFIKIINSSDNHYDEMMKIFNIKKHDCVLDIGFGAGQFLERTSKIAIEVFGVEPNKELFDYAERKIKIEDLKNICISQSAGEKLPFKNSSMDKVLCLSVIMMVDPLKMINEIKRVLKPGGTAFFHVSDIGYAFHCIRDGIYCREKERVKIGLSYLYDRTRRKILKRYNIGGVMSERDFEKFAQLTKMSITGFENISYFDWEPKTFWRFNRQFLVSLKKTDENNL